MEEKKILELIQGGESETLELKTSLSETRQIIGTIGAFSNKQGGTILIGVSPKGEIIGVQSGIDTLEKLANDIKQHTDPHVLPSIDTITVEGKEVIVVQVGESLLKPVLVYNMPFKRVGRSNHIMSSSELAQLALQSHGLSWDAALMDADFNEIDVETVRRFAQKTREERNLDIDPNMSLADVLAKLHLSRENRLTRAALLLFGKDPLKYFLQAQVRCARFHGLEPLDFLDMQVLNGSIIDQVPEALRFIQKNIRLATEIKEIQREERWEYPVLVHRHRGLCAYSKELTADFCSRLSGFL